MIWTGGGSGTCLALDRGWQMQGGAMCAGGAHCGQGAVTGLSSLQDGSSAAKERQEPPGQQGLRKASSF